MKKTLFTAVIFLTAAPALAQVPVFLPNPSNDEVRAPRPPRARGIPVPLAEEALLAGLAACRDMGNKTDGVVVDSEGGLIVMVSDDGATAQPMRSAMGKAQIVIRTKGPSTAAEKLDPKLLEGLGAPHPGGLPLMAGNELVGALAIGGSPKGPQDDDCAKVAVDKIKDRIK